MFDPQNLKKGVKTAAHMYHPSYREYPPPPGVDTVHAVYIRGGLSEFVGLCPAELGVYVSFYANSL